MTTLTLQETLEKALRENPNTILATISEAAQFLHCSRKTIERRISDGTIPAVKLSSGMTLVIRVAIDEKIRQTLRRDESPRSPFMETAVQR